MKFIRTVLLVLIIIGIALLVTQSRWVPPFVNWILTKENKAQTTQPDSVNAVIHATTTRASATSATTLKKLPENMVKMVALTFDDGPYGTSTKQVIDILQNEKVTATFFLVGKNVEEYPAIAKQIVADGYMVGNHTYDHTKNLTQLTAQEIKAELSKTDNAIASSTGLHTKLFRPPYGNINKRVRRILEQNGYRIILWNVDPRDWDYASSTSSVIERTIEHQEKMRMTILMHDGRDTQINYPRGNLTDALPAVIEDLKNEGYVFVTADKIPL